MIGKVFLSLLLAVVTGAVRAETYYVATDGKPEHDGSRERPWRTVEHALSQVGSGHTILVKPGLYHGPLYVGKTYSGTKQRPTIIRSETKWKAVLLGTSVHGIHSHADWIVIDGFEVMGARGDGIKIEADNNTVRNCWAHNNSATGITMQNRKGGVIENNLVEYNGSHPQHHHGIHASGDGLTLRGNIVRHNAAYGLHLHPEIKRSVIANNLVYGHAQKPGVLLACPKGGGQNRLVNNTVAENRGALTVQRGDGEAVMNNILAVGRLWAKESEAIDLDEGTKSVQADYNLCVPPSKQAGPHSLTGDPQFVDPSRGVFWLKPGSPAIGRGRAEHAPGTDFWGRSRPKDRAPDLGAFPFVPFLATPEARARWYFNWAYRYGAVEGRDMPDLWMLPPKALENRPGQEERR